jgi:hypothetical protein
MTFMPAFEPVLEPAVFVVDSYVRATERKRRVLSTRRAVRDVRQVLPNCRLSDRELLTLVERAAVGRRCGLVIFDFGDAGD